MSTAAMLRALQAEDARAATAVRRCLAKIAAVVEAIVPRYARGGRLIYVGAGTSGRIGALDAAEIPPTFGVERGRVVTVIAGGEAALTRAVEGAEDDTRAARREMQGLHLRRDDTVVGIAASGRTPFTVAAVRTARQRGCLTVAVANVKGSALAEEAAYAIELLTGAEAIAGSTRLKAGTAQKMTLNLISTGLMVRSGRITDNLMIHVQANNAKLWARAERILAAAAGWRGPNRAARARQALRAAGGDLPRAIAEARRP
jgi:N-acetylmuramic acid 6-phosphate etherase